MMARQSRQVCGKLDGLGLGQLLNVTHSKDIIFEFVNVTDEIIVILAYLCFFLVKLTCDYLQFHKMLNDSVGLKSIQSSLE